VGLARREGKAYCYDIHATILHLMGIDHEKLSVLTTAQSPADGCARPRHQGSAGVSSGSPASDLFATTGPAIRCETGFSRPASIRTSPRSGGDQSHDTEVLQLPVRRLD